ATGVVTDGNGGNNYNVTFTTDATGEITIRSITVKAGTDTKEYDGNVTSDGVPTITLGALQGSDTVTWTQTFDTPDVGTGKTLTPAGVVTDGNSGNNYTYTYVPDNTGVITASSSTPPAKPKTPSISQQDLNQLDINPFSTIYDIWTPGMGITIMPKRSREP
ncbi:MAG: YDG domain-containing protein, partial [Candidatus Omnitrophota bacterium]